MNIKDAHLEVSYEKIPYLPGTRVKLDETYLKRIIESGKKISEFAYVVTPELTDNDLKNWPNTRGKENYYLRVKTDNGLHLNPEYKYLTKIPEPLKTVIHASNSGLITIYGIGDNFEDAYDNIIITQGVIPKNVTIKRTFDEAWRNEILECIIKNFY